MLPSGFGRTVRNVSMSLLYQTTGFVLSRSDHREVDRRYTAFTKDRGKIDFLARGGNKPLAKLTPHLEMFAEVDLLVVVGRIFQTVAGVDRRRNFPNILKDPERLCLAQTGLHLIDIGTREHEHDAGVYSLIENWLTFLHEGPKLSGERAAFVLSSFVWKLTVELGYRPQLHTCLNCRKLIEARDYRWHGLRGGVVCQSCVRHDEQTWFAARPIDESTLKLLRFALCESFDTQQRVHLPSQALSEFHSCTESFIISHFPTIPANSLRATCLSIRDCSRIPTLQH
jgi:DNA repair protein RecO (recombination protein O)